MNDTTRTSTGGAGLLLALLACGGAAERGAGDTAASGATAATESRCYVAAQSLLGRETAPAAGITSNQPVPPDTLRGWLRLERSASPDSGLAWLVDSDGAGLTARWRRGAGDSLAITGFDDFQRVELNVAAADTALRGRALATSDAAADDSAGRMVELRREWTLSAARASCDSMP